MADAILAVTVTRDEVTASYSESMLRTVAHDATSTGRLVAGGGPMLLPATINTLAQQRNRAAAFLLDESPADWLLFVDSDMGWSEDAVDRLLEAADPVERPAVGALCFGLQKVKTDEMGGWYTRPFPTIYDWTHNEAGEGGFTIRWDYPRDTLTRVAATGAAFLLVHRDVFDKVRAQHGDTWFNRAMMPNSDLLGEDMSFCARLDRMGIPIHVHTGVRTTHYKSLWISEEFYIGARLAAALADDADRTAAAVREGFTPESARAAVEAGTDG